MIVLKRPIITEKSLALAAKGFYTFEVGRAAKKPEIARAVTEAFKVEVVSVSTIMVKGRSRRVGRMRTEINLGNSKKAIVQLKKDQKIALFDTGK